MQGIDFQLLCLWLVKTTSFDSLLIDCTELYIVAGVWNVTNHVKLYPIGYNLPWAKLQVKKH